MFARYPINVSIPAGLPHMDCMLNLLQDLLPVKFLLQPSSSITRKEEATFDASKNANSRGSVEPAATLTVPISLSSNNASGQTLTHITFTHASMVPWPFRGKRLLTGIPSNTKPLFPDSSEQVLCFSEEGPLWTQSSPGPCQQFRSALSLPTLDPKTCLFEVLNGQRFLELLPLIHFLRLLPPLNTLEPPPLRASFLFDDPNLHWKTYGYLDFQLLAVRAAKCNYHVAFATIPLDSWYVNPRAASLFRTNQHYISLLVHGNNHIKNELGKQYSSRARGFLLEQALSRIADLEQKSQVAVSRVMAAPHGACSNDMLRALPSFGFESATISHSSLRKHNYNQPWAKRIGYLPSEVIGGCPVLPRWSLTQSTTNTLLLAAFLHQSIILIGHHTDLKHGVELLDELADYINSLGDVLWSDMTTLSRSNYDRAYDQDTLKLSPRATIFTVNLPTEVRHILVESECSHDTRSWLVHFADGSSYSVNTNELLLLPPHPTTTAIFRLKQQSTDIKRLLVPTRPALFPFSRRILTEMRDRVLGCR